MKRSEFLKDFVGTAASVLLVACNKDLLDVIVSSENLDTITIEEAEKWFNETYRPKYVSLSTVSNEKAGYKRNGTKKLPTEKKWQSSLPFQFLKGW
ncbi:MAG: hypothetical protein EAZ70_06165 [Runella slithyformis]|nr:MAG: hypothetical protein EAY79_05225 [Runella slithyformis]TAF28213.1 MAG: hypothetical protein EAZ70_06165 [Runella slithyformis]TAF46861.1 MAG: hypothetical protein EAZ63_08880 [Runella slithyformis]TAF81822.1 MAG: hypothetical protein EAZ50_05355 [Runella slithyformis]